MKVLLVEDNLLTSQVTAGLLASRGLYVACACCVGQAMELAEKLTRPDVLVVDMYLPDGTGLELVRQLRQRLGWEGIPVVLATAGDLADVAREIRPEDRPLQMLGKPFDVTEAVAAILHGQKEEGT
jgi:CheY-like chemotaxis protein